MLSNEKRPACRQAGQSLMELVVVIAVMVTVIGALTFATIASLRNAQFAKNQAQATKLAQEGLEWVRTGRDRNSNISGIPSSSVISWNGDGTRDSSIWEYQISGINNSGFCDNKDTTTNPPTVYPCYFKVSSDGKLTHILIVTSTFPTKNAEAIPPLPEVAIFRRAITLSDDADFNKQKTVTAIVTWTDFSGSHESKLATILRRI